jgi:hypothetical protein
MRINLIDVDGSTPNLALMKMSAHWKAQGATVALNSGSVGEEEIEEGKGGGMKRQNIFIVMAHTEYEGSDPVQAFTDEAVAQSFASECNAYSRKSPPAPTEIKDTPANDAEWELYYAKRERWEKRHPAGASNVSCDSFPVMKIPLSG